MKLLGASTCCNGGRSGGVPSAGPGALQWPLCFCHHGSIWTSWEYIVPGHCPHLCGRLRSCPAVLTRQRHVLTGNGLKLEYSITGAAELIAINWKGEMVPEQHRSLTAAE